jgi:hypothetical protein
VCIPALKEIEEPEIYVYENVSKHLIPGHANSKQVGHPLRKQWENSVKEIP